jgi:Rrf2 family transcriptional regulator, nitric oxide-sensitive transcriptional repressor
MMRIRQETCDQLLILALVGRVGGAVTISSHDIAARLGMPLAQVQKLTNKLARAGFLEALRGRNGGVRMACDPSALGIGQLIIALEDSEFGDALPGMSDVMNSAFGAMIAALDDHTLADLMFDPCQGLLPAPHAKHLQAFPTADHSR